MPVKVTNIDNTSALSCGCGSWMNHWERGTGKTANMCFEVGCSRTDLVGAHIRREGDQGWYIIPLCKGHNAATASFMVVDGHFVSANVSATCA